MYDQSILGGVTMVAYEARYDLLNSAARPIEQKLAGTLIDELDVADLESEAAHGYEINLGAGREASNRVHRDNTRSNNWKHEAPTRPIDPGDRLEAEEIQQVWADGGRFLRYADRFVAHLKPDVATQAVARWVGPDDGEVQLVVESGSRVLAMVTMGAHVTREVAFSIPPDVAAEQTPILVRAVNGSTFGSLHYWFAIEPE
ncbi:MAG: hypothetical protein CSA75_04895 [Sorangium cellulosum]|nr:MAG: hypothetical protein CSA75_04895 [Sorangium cellulosum]